MSITDFFKGLGTRVKSQNNETQSQMIGAIEGQPEYSVPLSTYNITYHIIPYANLLDYEVLQMFSEELNIPHGKVKSEVSQTTKGLKKNLSVCIEYPYVDEYYRDTYYDFYARKHNNYNRFCFRLSFFSEDVNDETFYSFSEDEMQEKYYGFIVLRPTPKRMIGYTFLSPLAYGDHNFSICLCQRTVSIKGRLLTTRAFPFSAQDGEMNTCAETAVTMIFDYFSRCYNKYARVLPSQIGTYLTDSDIDRKQPSKGIDINTIANILNNNGVNTRQYLKAKDEDDLHNNNYCSEEHFYRLLKIYVESGFPIYATLDTHAIVIIGRQNLAFENGSKYIVMDDNKRPYVTIENEKDIDGFIVPIPENILLDADDLDPLKYLTLLAKDYPKADIADDPDSYFHRIYLTTSRSFKDYILNSTLTYENKELVICTAMPRFIWVCESILKKDLLRHVAGTKVTYLTVCDSTDYPNGYNHLLLAKSPKSLLIPEDDRSHMQRKQYRLVDSRETLTTFTNNLRGDHNGWRC